MRRWRVLVPTLLAISLVAAAALPAAAEKPETWAVVPFDFTFGPVLNPCTGEDTDLHVMGEYKIHALPSVDSYLFGGDFTHVNVKVTGQAVGDDGYVSVWKPYRTGTINMDGDHYVESSVENVMFYGEDGGKYRVHSMLKLVMVDGDIKVELETTDAACIRPPTS